LQANQRLHTSWILYFCSCSIIRWSLFGAPCRGFFKIDSNCLWSEVTDTFCKSNTTELQKLKHVIQIGWQEMKYGVSHDTSIYFDVRDEFTVQNGLIFKGERVPIPKTLRLDMTRKIPI
jgi:hypothetical protein